MELPGLGSVFRILLFVAASWILIHLWAVFGFFLAVAYPIWWILAPRKTFCFLCRTKQKGDWCPFCRHKVGKAKGRHPVSFASTLKNSGLILFLSFFSLGGGFFREPGFV